MNRNNKRGGFTLVELMLVVIIIAVLAGVVLPRLVGQQEIAKVNAAKAQLKTFDTVLYTYQLEVGSFPTTDQGLKALVEDPGVNNWNGPYLLQKNLPKDPWGNPYEYSREAKVGIDYDLFSWGPDGQQGTEDDIYSSKEERGSR